MGRSGDDEGTTGADRCLVCGEWTTVPLCSLTCRALARQESAENEARIGRLRELGFDVCLDEVQSVVRRNLELRDALDDPALVSHGRVSEPAGR